MYECGICGGVIEILGFLGGKAKGRCRNCHMIFHLEGIEEEIEEDFECEEEIEEDFECEEGFECEEEFREWQAQA